MFMTTTYVLGNQADRGLAARSRVQAPIVPTTGGVRPFAFGALRPTPQGSTPPD